MRFVSEEVVVPEVPDEAAVPGEVPEEVPAEAVVPDELAEETVVPGEVPDEVPEDGDKASVTAVAMLDTVSTMPCCACPATSAILCTAVAAVLRNLLGSRAGEGATGGGGAGGSSNTGACATIPFRRVIIASRTSSSALPYTF